MKEKIYEGKKNGMLVLIVTILLYCVAIAGIVFSGMALDAGKTIGAVGMVISILYVCVGWIPWCGLKVIRPQEALVLTLFGKYVGTLKEDGFYYVNPFCSAVNPAAKTKLNQSGDVRTTSMLSV
ncbi:MAG: SPFH domain-containing protein, partial [Lachnospiraceae bacterium]|nr:SPFH domain-containing protein [Lachnospiraceae bacterium]